MASVFATSLRPSGQSPNLARVAQRICSRLLLRYCPCTVLTISLYFRLRQVMPRNRGGSRRGWAARLETRPRLGTKSCDRISIRFPGSANCCALSSPGRWESLPSGRIPAAPITPRAERSQRVGNEQAQAPTTTEFDRVEHRGYAIQTYRFPDPPIGGNCRRHSAGAASPDASGVATASAPTSSRTSLAWRRRR